MRLVQHSNTSATPPHRSLVTATTALEDLPEVLTIEETTVVLRISRTAAYGLASQYLATGGREGLPVVRLGRSLRVPRARLLRLLDGTDDATVGG